MFLFFSDYFIPFFFLHLKVFSLWTLSLDEDEDEEDEDEEYDEDAEIAAIEEKFAIPPELHIEEWMYNFKDRFVWALEEC